MKIFKGYKKNHHRLEALIVERHITEDNIDFCSNYLSKEKSIGILESRRHGRYGGRGTQGFNVSTMDRDVFLQAHFHILNNIDEVQPYLSAHKSLIKKKFPQMSEKWMLTKHNKTFIRWFNERVSKDNNATEAIIWLSCIHKFIVIAWSAYDITNFSFYKTSKDHRSTMENSGVRVEAKSMCFSSSKNKNLVLASRAYFGIIEEILEIDYVLFKVAFFKCKWIDSNNGVQNEALGFTRVDLQKVAYMDELFIMASHAKQVFYVTNPSNNRWSIVLQGKHKLDSDENQDLHFETPSFATHVRLSSEENDSNDAHVIRYDHHKGTWEN